MSRVHTTYRPSRFVTWLALLAFLLQGLVVQSHIHIASLEAAAPTHQGSPAKKAPVECPACQLQASTAAMLVPQAIVPFLQVGWVASIALPVTVLAVWNSVRQGWRSRAPPVR